MLAEGKLDERLKLLTQQQLLICDEIGGRIALLEFAPRRGKLSEISHIGIYLEKLNTVILLGFSVFACGFESRTAHKKYLSYSRLF